MKKIATALAVLGLGIGVSAPPALAKSKGGAELAATGRTLLGPAVTILVPGVTYSLGVEDATVCATAVAESGAAALNRPGGSVSLPQGRTATACAAGDLELACVTPDPKSGSCTIRYRVDLLERKYALEVSVDLPPGMPPAVTNGSAGLSCQYGTCSAEVRADATLLVVALPALGCSNPSCGGAGTLWQFQGWTGCDEVLVDYLCIVRMTGERELEAEYAEQ